ncbi:uncharacterized protein LOC119838593 [Zerene cesonia]|uniref:uncharacterized protein LOC119838593 n=1 Tax=Zerene cesonia TaxID=33412 RepID=UPI0018E5462F|nr:uncharacterized protein LOC119838593 [Zerene cesonia]
MSLKGKTRSPRAMPIEAVVTRFKSAQLKNKQCSKTLQKIQSNKPKPPPKIKPKAIDNLEFYPNKLKRTMDVKKIVLAPKHDYKVVAGKWNKRKPCVPRKECYNQIYNSERCPSPTPMQREETISEMIKLIEDTGNFDDDDLMEILTCPSPVWWEDPPDGYVEDPISRLTPEIVDTKLIEEESSKENKMKEVSKLVNASFEENSCREIFENNQKLNINVKIDDPKFIKKRGKLESLLGNLKNKINKVTNPLSKEIVCDAKTNLASDLLNTSLDEDTILNSLENMEIPIDNSSTSKFNNNETPNINTEQNNQLDVDKDSDADIKITDDILKDSDKTINKLNSLKDIKVNVLKDASLSALKYLETDTSDFVTVYKIINNDTIDNKESEKSGQINSYFKNCKNVRRHAKRNLEGTDNKKCIVVSDQETVKYCLKCSAIFDTEDCIYCMQKIKAST